MNPTPDTVGTRPCWFVGAVYNDTDDQIPRFISEGIWGNGYEDRYLDQVISIKSTHTYHHRKAEVIGWRIMHPAFYSTRLWGQ